MDGIVATVQWQPWNLDAFARARAEDKPVLLAIAASWCDACDRMDRTTYATPEIVSAVNDRFVAVRVDADRRPDISERYNLGGWPTTAFLTADGGVIGGGTFLSPERMTAALDRVASDFKTRRAELAAGRETKTPSDALISPGERDLSPSVDALTASVFGSFDREHGGFGGAPKFPLVAPLELAVDRYREAGDPGMAHVLQLTLDSIGWGGLHDDVDGGFYRCADSRDWQEPRREKMLDVNAGLLGVYVETSRALNVARYRERAEDTLRYVQTWLADQVDGAWAGSQRSDATYYSAPADRRRECAPPPIDATIYTGWNALMVSATLRAAELFDDTPLGEFALRSLERVVTACYRPGAGVAHYFDGGQPAVRGLLDDQALMIAANLDAHAATGNIVYEMMAQELAHYAIRAMWDDTGGGFFDRAVAEPAERIGLMRQRLKPFVANCEMARALGRLANSRGDHDFGARAEATLAAMAPMAPSQGPLAAHYLMALRTPTATAK
jgi:uncharacterized protein